MIDPLFSRRYSAARYNCAHFVIEAWRTITGQDVEDKLRGVLCAPTQRRLDLDRLRGVEFLAAPKSPCFVLMQRPRGLAHVGIWYKERVLHLLESGGVQYMPLEIASLGFNRVRFFLCK